MRKFAAGLFFLLVAQGAAASQPLSHVGRAAFRKAVEEYQMFVVPHCAAEDVRAYVMARAQRDRQFVRSLRGSALKQDYEQAITDRAARDRSTLYECFGPPPPPGMPQPSPAQLEAKRHDSLIAHFAAGDRQFEELVKIRDGLTGHSRR